MKRLIQSLKVEDNEQVGVIEDKLALLVQNIREYTEKYLNTKGVFILVALLENSKHADALRSHLGKYGSFIAERANFKGIQLLQDLI